MAGGSPAVPYAVTLKDGAKLEGVLPMQCDAYGGTWFGVERLDWHLRKPARQR